MSTSPPLLDVKDLNITFGSGESATHAVRGIDFSIAKGETVAVVGESGSGKSVTALSLVRLLPPPPTCRIEGDIHFSGHAIQELRTSQLRELRGKSIAYIFQEPSTSLNPVFSIHNQISEALLLHRPEVREISDEIERLLELVKIPNAKKRMHDYPHQLSGGMQQRVMIAMALACRPKLLVADEPTTALDVTIQSEIMELLVELKNEFKMAIMLITHNFGIVSGFADRVIVMFRGNIVEQGPTQEVLNNPQHPYTQALIDCIPKLGKKQERLTTIDYDKISGATQK
ncbi:MAG: ABC transporter ATP-binding protein [Verrucomicrobiota bacterium]